MWMTIVSGLFATVKATDEATQETIADNEKFVPGSEMKLPSPEELLEMLDSMTGISDEEKANIKEELMQNIAGRLPGGRQTGDLTTQTFMLLFLLAIVALIFVFFTYKLFRCLKERELKKEEKKKNKQLKKKK